MAVKDSDMIIARMGKGEKIVTGSDAVTGQAFVVTGLATVERVLNAYATTGRVSGELHGVDCFKSDVAGNIVINVYRTDAVGDVTLSGTAKTIEWTVLGTK